MADHEFAYMATSTFMGAPRLKDAPERPFGIAGIPYDGAVTNRPGARFGPEAIRRASLMLCDATHSHFDLSPLNYLADAGDLRAPNTSIETMRASVQPQIAQLIAQRQMCWLGGDHSITLPLLRAYRQHYGKPLALLHFDAHCDTWTDHFGEPSGHGTWVYEAITEGLVDPTATVQVGIRSAGERAAREYVNDMGGKVWTARMLRGLENPAQLAPLLDEIRQRFAGHDALYLSFDIDCLDPAYAPGTGTPEPGGLTSNQVLTIIEELCDLPWVGMDCVEVAPAYDHAELTVNMASHLVWTWLSGRAHQYAQHTDQA
ncbi:agmatinase [Amantichitinum ursilacus]|uniref:Guanidinobutyrase n=1 Tax=Amantichitinum ursilacus TaxID=857265 RepID=A0A0N0GLC4_9NEIS|nr:agmatinase [Amantichitinum ursilacus]KPC49705.1 Guanidinobutyrase [Amantichitinum ursilacus]